MIYLYFAIIVLVSYLIGNINFAKIMVRLIKKDDITKKGSGNPGTMNVLRNYGIGLGFLVLLLEAVKAGVPAIISAVLMNGYGLYDLAFFVSGASVILGQVFPVVYKFKGGKGIACTVGLYFFTSYWWVGIIVFFVSALILYLFDYAFLASLTFVTIMTIVLLVHEIRAGVQYLWIIIVLISLIWVFAMINHRSNFKRFFANKENKTGFRHKILMATSKKYREWIKQEEIKEMKKKEAAKLFVEQEEEERKKEKEEKKIQRKVKKARKKYKKSQKKIKRRDKRKKKTKNGKRNPFKLRFLRKKDKEEKKGKKNKKKQKEDLE